MFIYFDNASTTPIDKRVWRRMEMFQFDEGFGNASSVHALGIRASKAIEECRQKIARRVNAKAEEVFFLSGGSEANNWVIKSLLNKARSRNSLFHWATTETEHSSIHQLASWVRAEGGKITFIPVDLKGRVEMDFLENLLSQAPVDLISLSHANSETGTLQPLAEICRLSHNYPTQIHLDACQSFLKTEIDFKEPKLNYVVLSAHKVHGPKGIGALVMKRESQLKPLILGGGQENGLRSGTLNTEGIVGFGEAVEIFTQKDQFHITELKHHFVRKLQEDIPKAVIQGDWEKGVCSVINFRIPGQDGKKLMQRLSRESIYVSTGSACDSGNKSPSRTLTAMGLSKADAFASLRVSFSKMNTEAEIELFIKVLVALQ